MFFLFLFGHWSFSCKRDPLIGGGGGTGEAGGITFLRPPSSLVHRYALLRKSKERQWLDGLNNFNYFANITYGALYKNITVNLTPELAQVTEY